jgi:tetratricopeptide (TPR) repeat protein
VGSKVPTRYRLLRARVLAKLPDRVIEARGEVDRALQADATDSSLWVFDAYIANVLGDYPGALESAATALGYEPSAATAHTERAIALTALGDREQALSEAQAALDLGNDDHRALSVIARLRSDAGDHDGAIGAWSDAIRRSGRRVPAWYLRQLGYEQYQARHYAAAAETLNRAIERDPKDPDALRIQGDVAAADERPRDAIGYYDRAASLRAYDPLLLRNRALALRQLNRPRRALQTLSLLTRRERDWNGGQAYFDSGLILLYDLHKPDSARLQFEAAIQRSPEWGEARYQLAQALWRLPTYAQPMHRALLENAFAEAIRCDPNDARSFRDRGYFRYGLGGRTQDAFDDFQRATQLDDDDPWSHYYLGFYGLDEIGADARSSLAEIDRAIDLSKEPEFFRGRAYILAFRERNYPAAYGAIDRAMKRDREFLPAYFVKSLIILDEERASPARGRQRALKVLTAAATAVDGRQARASIAWVRGDVLLGLEDPKGALREYDQALKITPNEPALQLSKAESLIKLGRWQAALNAVDTAIARSDAYSAAYMKKAYVLLQPLTPVCDVKGAQDALKIARSLDPTSPNLAELESFAAGKGAEHCAPDASQA